MNAPLQAPDLFCDFVDGQTAVLQRVVIRFAPAVAPDHVEIVKPDGETLVWPFSQLRRQPDQAGEAFLTLSRTDNPLARLMVRDAVAQDVFVQNCANLKRRPPSAGHARLLGWAAGALASVALIIFVLVPLMADQLAQYLPPEGEKALGDATFDQIRNALSETGIDPVKVCTGAQGQAAMDKMRQRLNASDDLPYEIQVHVLDHDMVNAFALPGGRIVFFRGLIETAEAPEEVAAVLAHEIGHVVGRDPTRDAMRSAGSIGVLGLLFGDFAGGSLVLFLTNQLINASYSQDAEAAADTYAHALMRDAGLSPHFLGTLFQRLRDEHGDAEGLVAHFTSHPRLGDRIAASAEAAAGFQARAPVLEPAEWRALRNMCDKDYVPRPVPAMKQTDPGKKG